MTDICFSQSVRYVQEKLSTIWSRYLENWARHPTFSLFSHNKMSTFFGKDIWKLSKVSNLPSEFVSELETRDDKIRN